MSSNGNYNIATYANTGISLNLFVNTNTSSPSYHIFTRSQTKNIPFCKICNMYNCYHTNPVTPHNLHNSQCACMQRNAGNY
jgi:hypothetical protein